MKYPLQPLGGLIEIGIGPLHAGVIERIPLRDGRELVADQFVVFGARVFERTGVGGCDIAVLPRQTASKSG